MREMTILEQYHNAYIKRNCAKRQQFDDYLLKYIQ